MAPARDISAQRIELKFVTGEGHTDRLLRWLRIHPAAFGTPYPSRRINNVYFDDYDYAAAGQVVGGVRQRFKLRYRWYGTGPLPGPGVLEIKCRRNAYNQKLSYPIADSPFEGRSSWREITAALAAQLPPEARNHLLSYPVPTLINSYHRRYFLSADRKVRITIDTDQRFLDQRASSRPNLRKGLAFAGDLVLEVKAEREHVDRAKEIVRTIPLRLGRNSKYLNGIEALSQRIAGDARFVGTWDKSARP